MKRALIAAPLLFAALTVSCSSGLDQRYLNASLEERLELPPDLVETAADSNFDLPNTITGDAEPQRGKIPVLARVDSLKLESSGNMYWLSVDQPVEDLYQAIKDFWLSEGIRLTVDEPAIGIMQTEWIYKEVGGEHKPDNWFLALFDSDDLSAIQDQFRTRIERGPGNSNRIYIAHRGAEYKHVLGSGGESKGPTEGPAQDNEWHFRQPEPELEIEMLSRLMLYLGLQQADVDEQVAHARLYAPLAVMHLDSEKNSPYLIIKNPYQIAWNRVIHQLDRMNFEILSQEFKSGLSGEGVIFVKTLIRKEPDKNGFFGFLEGEETRERKLTLVLSEESHELTRVDIETADGDFDTSPEGTEFLSLLYRRIR